MNILEIKEKLDIAFQNYPINILTREEDIQWLKDNDMFNEGDEEGDEEYLIVMDSDENMFLGGAYQVTMENGKFYGEWLPYPEEPIRDVEEFINKVKEK